VSRDHFAGSTGVHRRLGVPVARPAVEVLEDRLAPTTLPAGFTEATVASGFNGPTAMEFAPDGRLFVLEQGGNVKLVQSGGTTVTALHLNVDSAGERGLLGIAFDPAFAADKFVYLYYTNPNAGGAAWAAGEHNQLSRFTVDDTNPQQPVFTSEAPILDWNSLSSATNHNGGAIHFGLDGMLYADAGDNAQTFTGPDGHTYRVSQTLGNLLGKQLRIDVAKFNSGAATRDDTTVGHLIPADNPFVGTATGINQLVYALGLRNPYTFAVQPGTGTIFVNDVGENTWEEIDQSTAGGNYGWSGGATDGFGHPPPVFAAGTYHDPLLAYNHSGGPAGGGIAIVGGTFYNPATAQFPASYVGKYFYEDLGAGWIRVFDPADPGSPATPDTSTGFATGTPGGLRDLKVDAVGNLYYLSGGDGTVRRISYQAPQITGQPADQTVTAGQPATFSAAASGPSLTYQWQHLVGTTWTTVGTNAATLTIANAQSADAGSYRVTVSNSFGSVTSNTASLTVGVPGSAPAITTQPTDQHVNVGQPAAFSVAAAGAIPLTYQWQKLVGSSWTNIGSDAPTLTINPATTDDAGSYRVVVSNAFGSVTSNPANLTAAATQPFAVGADAGGAPTVTMYNPDGSTLFSVTPFDTSFTGGVRVATGDFNGDGVADLVVGTGPGIATQVEVLDGKDQHVIFSTAPFESSFTGGVYVAAGDLTGDGTPDLVITPDQGGGPRCRVFNGNGFGLVADFFGISDPNFRGGARAAVGDVNGDGVGDLVVAAGFQGGPRVAVWDGRTLPSGDPVRLFNDFFAFEQTLRNGVFVTAGDIDGDGKADIIAGGGPGGGPRVTVFSAADLLSSGGGTLTQLANFFGGDPNNRGGIRVAAKNLDGDAKADLVVGAGTGAGSTVTAYLGKAVSPTGTPPTDFSFDAFPGFSGGVFVG
jgi:glucose/arabinose dehydrogenase